MRPGASKNINRREGLSIFSDQSRRKDPCLDPKLLIGLKTGMKNRYRIPSEKTFRIEEEIKRSRFIATVGHTPDVESAKAFISEIREEFPDATHNCWAYAAGPPGDTARVGYSDDGEPHGTAGRPMLQALLYGGVGEVACVVTRYFGGIKLGAGGLVRAYSGITADALRQSPVKEKIIPARYEIILDYSRITLFKRLLPKFEAAIVEERFGTDAEFKVLLPEEHSQRFITELCEMTDGEVLVTDLDAGSGKDFSD